VIVTLDPHQPKRHSPFPTDLTQLGNAGSSARPVDLLSPNGTFKGSCSRRRPDGANASKARALGGCICRWHAVVIQDPGPRVCLRPYRFGETAVTTPAPPPTNEGESVRGRSWELGHRAVVEHHESGVLLLVRRATPTADRELSVQVVGPLQKFLERDAVAADEAGSVCCALAAHVHTGQRIRWPPRRYGQARF
jgi:hypothetical protein